MGVDIKYDKWNKIQGKTTCNNGVVYLGINTIKGCGKNVSNALLELGSRHYSHFCDLLHDLNESPDINSGQIETLIKLQLFNEFGGTFKLLKTYLMHQSYSGTKIIKKEKNTLPLDVVQKYTISETLKQYRFDKDAMNAMLKELANDIENKEIPLRIRMKTELEYLGYISYIDQNAHNTGLVLEVNTKYSPRITVYRIDTGATIIYKLQKALYQNNPFDTGDIIKFYAEDRPKSKKVDGQWVKLSETEPWITNFLIKSDL